MCSKNKYYDNEKLNCVRRFNHLIIISLEYFCLSLKTFLLYSVESLWKLKQMSLVDVQCHTTHPPSICCFRSTKQP